MLDQDNHSPLSLKIGFNKLLEHYEVQAKSKDSLVAANAKYILDTQKPYPELREGFSDIGILKKREKEIAVILHETFSGILTKNEIKTATVPFHDIIFNSSERFQNIIKDAGPDFELEITNMTEDHFYIIGCVVILQFCYNYRLDFKRPFYYQIPDSRGIVRYYRIIYNADFMEIAPTKNAIPITQEDIDELMDNFDNIEMWKEKFPPNTYEAKGFIISNMFDVTADVSISNIKSSLIGIDKRKSANFMENFQEVFQSLFGIPDLKVGFSAYNAEEDQFERVYGHGIESYLLNNEDNVSCNRALCPGSYDNLLKKDTFFAISDVEKYNKISGGGAPYKALHECGIKSAIFAPISDNGQLLAVIELVSNKAKELNSVNANKLIDVMPFIVQSVLRSKEEEENQIEAIIQQECTSIHASVHWKFEREARQFLRNKIEGEEASFSKIAFENVYPLYGQMDIKGSSDARNNATREDLTIQLRGVLQVIDQALTEETLPIYEQLKFRVQSYLTNLTEHFQVDSEQGILALMNTEIHPLFKHLSGKNEELKTAVENYKNKVDDTLGIVYDHRKNYDDTVAMINRQMASLLDEKQLEAQKMYPHYFERFKTDGVEHNMYIGEAITKEESFNPIYLYNLRLWQLQVMCEMENEYYHMQSEFPMQLDVASMILVFNNPLTISFRMDEKQFDVDGTYNARYEVVKKRVDKAFIKGTSTRITEKGKITIVYAQKKDEEEYLQYIRFLQSKNYLDKRIQIVELEELQGVTGLRAIRVDVLYSDDEKKEFYTYNDLMKELNPGS